MGRFYTYYDEDYEEIFNFLYPVLEKFLAEKMFRITSIIGEFKEDSELKNILGLK